MVLYLPPVFAEVFIFPILLLRPPMMGVTTNASVFTTATKTNDYNTATSSEATSAKPETTPLLPFPNPDLTLLSLEAAILSSFWIVGRLMKKV